ncbi:malectin domain-containing carbohydrate-binding protein [Halococcus agarilyticus]|uniref:malectin domain-containing carbohydrate-binding protein n=1 Tax=Halococcus agarilyticus TaxID=1232219 RepID=UPI0006783397|nr:malectin domain-containing carbohydrate-binding protein [Halococcus agarilyticus]
MSLQRDQPAWDGVTAKSTLAVVVSVLTITSMFVGSMAFAGGAAAQTSDQTLYRVNAGGSTVSAPSGPDWSGNLGEYSSSSLSTYSTGDSITLGPSVPDGTPSELFTSEAYGKDIQLAFSENVQSGQQYEVRLYFAEIFQTAESQRIFDVSVEGQTVLDGYDIYADVGHDTGVMKSFTTTPSDGTIDVSMSAQMDNAKLSAIEIVAAEPQADELGGPSSVDFGKVVTDNSQTETATVTNLGGSGDPSIDISGVSVTGTDAGEFSAGSASQTTLAPGESADILVTFSPSSVDPKSATLEVSHTGSNSPLTVDLSGEGASAVDPDFGKSKLQGFSAGNPTALEWGPDDRLYVSTQGGSVYVLDIERNGENSYQVVNEVQIDAVKDIPNHDDLGNIESESNRQITGLTVGGTADQPVVYVGSSDPEIDVGQDDDDTDTNSGAISRLTINPGSDGVLQASEVTHDVMVLGLPRSEENHATNGLDLTADGDTLYVAQGGHTNKGAPGDNFGHTPEYALSAAVLEIDLAQIENNHEAKSLQSENSAYPDLDYLYSIPTIKGGALPFGGNDGENQAKLIEGGPVQVYSPGYRNPYDLVLTEDGQLYVSDHGPNGGWGGQPADANGNIVSDAASVTNHPNEAGSYSTNDQLVGPVQEGDYAGHAAPIRANPTQADIYDANGNVKFDITSSNSPVPSSMVNPVEADYIPPTSGSPDPGADAGTAHTMETTGGQKVLFGPTGGTEEYTASNFGGAMQGDILQVELGGDIERIELDAAGDTVTNQETIFNTGGPLGIDAVGDDGPFPGTVWTSNHGGNDVTAFEPVDYGGDAGGGGETCDPEDVVANAPEGDADGDGYTNIDEDEAGSDPCSAASTPPDFDDDGVSNLNDPNDDNDNLDDTEDPFAVDPNNGVDTTLPVQHDLSELSLFGENGQGWTGVMTNGENYQDLYDTSKMTVGGAAEVLTVEEVPQGDAHAGTNTQQYGFQFGVNTPDEPFVIESTVASFPESPENFQSAGIQIGTGDQSNYIKLVAAANGGNGGVEFAKEVDDSFDGQMTDESAVTGNEVTLRMTVDPTTDPAPDNDVNEVAVTAEYEVDGTTTEVGTLAMPSSWLDTSDGVAPAVGIISTSNGASPFSATWTDISVDYVTPPENGAPTADAGADQTVDEGSQVTLDASASDDPDGDQLGYTWTQTEGPDVSPSQNDGETLTFTAPEVDSETTLTFQVSVSDGQASDTDTVNVTVQDTDGGTPSEGEVVYRVNAGGQSVAATDDGPAWSADTGSSPSQYVNVDGDNGLQTYSTSDAITLDDSVPADTPSSLFQTERYDVNTSGSAADDTEMQWSFDAEQGATYDVRLYFAEIFLTESNVDSQGPRVFDVNVEGDDLELDDYNIYQQYGHDVGAMESFEVTPSDGTVDIEFLHEQENPKISAIEIVKVDDGGETNAEPTATFEYTPQSPTAGEEVSFDASGSSDADGSIASYSWDFDGDGQEDATGETATATFDAAGDQAVTLTVTDDDGAENSVSQTVSVGEAGPQNTLRIVGSGTWTTYEFDVGGTIDAGASSSIDSADSIANDGKSATGGVGSGTDTYVFTGELGDLAVDGDATVYLNGERIYPEEPVQQNTLRIVGSGTWTTYEFSVSGTIDEDASSSLGGADSIAADGKSATGGVVSGTDKYVFTGELDDLAVDGDATVYLNGEEIDPADYGDANQNPTAAFSYSPQNPAAGEEVSFDASKSSDADGSIASYSWDFDGDGQEDATGETATATFDAAGDYEVSLTVTDSGGATSTTSKTIPVGGVGQEQNTLRIVGSGTWTTYEFSVSGTIDEDASSSLGGADSIAADGKSATGGVVSGTDKYVFTGELGDLAVDGDATVYLNGEEIDPADYGDANQNPTAAFSYSPQNPAAGEEVSFDASESSDADGSIASYSWDFDGDGQEDATGETATATFDSAGDQTVTLTVTDDDGAENAASQTVSVVETPDAVGSALVEITPDSGLETSTYGSGSYQVTNTGEKEIVSVSFDLDTATLPDMVFDPQGTAGDPTGEGLNIASEGGTGIVTEPGTGEAFSQPHNGNDGEDGYDVMTVEFDDFQNGETATFWADNDPTSIKGATVGSQEAGPVSGLELARSTVTIEYADGTTQTTQLMGDGSDGGSTAVVNGDEAPAPSIGAQGVSLDGSVLDGYHSGATVSEASQTVTVSGEPGETVTLVRVEGELALSNVPNGGYNLEDLEANNAVNVEYYTATLDSNGEATVPVTLTDSPDDDDAAGYNYFVAAQGETSGDMGLASNVVVLEYDESAGDGGGDTGSGETVFAVNAGGSEYTAADGTVYQADTNFDGGSTFTSGSAGTPSEPEIANTENDQLYWTERYGDFSYDVPVDNGEYEVTLQFAEIYQGVANDGGEGDRVFDASIEGEQVLTDYDIYATAGGPHSAVSESFTTEVTDGELNIEFSTVVDNAKVSAIEVTAVDGGSGGSNTAPTIDAISDQTVVEGDSATVPVTASDDDGDSVSLSVNGPGFVSLSNGELTIAPESGAAADSPYTVEVVADDGTTTTTESFQLTVEEPSAGGAGSAEFAVNANGGIDASTFSGGSFEITNTGDKQITSVTYDLSSATLPDVVFDPQGTAGDSGAKGFTPDSGSSATGLQEGSFATPHNGQNGDDGYDELTASFDDFENGESFAFSVDIDPTSIKNAQGTGAAGSVSGLEMSGATVTVEYADGSTQTTNLYGDGSDGGSQATAKPDVAGAPTLGAQDVSLDASAPDPQHSAATVSSASQTITVSGPADATVELLHVEGQLELANQADGYNLEDYEANTAEQVSYQTVDLGSNGEATVDVTLTNTSSSGAEGGFNHFIATVADGDGDTGATSNVVVLKLDESSGSSNPQVLHRVNVGESTTVSATDDGPDWTGVADTSSQYLASADTDNGGTYCGGDDITADSTVPASTPDAVFDCERYGNMTWEFSADAGQDVEVRLYFANSFPGASEPGDRQFNVSIEGDQALTQYDPVADVGHATGTVKTFTVTEDGDGTVTIAFEKGAIENPEVRAIEIVETDGSSQ